MKLGKQWKIALAAAIIGNIFSYFTLLGPAERLNLDVLNIFLSPKISSEDIVIFAID